MLDAPHRIPADALDLYKDTICPTLEIIEAWHLDAAKLLLGCGLVESKLKFRRQVGGPARGLWQMEEPTHDWLVNAVLYRRPAFAAGLRHIVDRDVGEGAPFEFHQLEYHDAYACALARLRFLVDPRPLGSDLVAHARTWKRVYNTTRGKGTVAKFIGDVASAAPGLYGQDDWVSAAAFLAQTAPAHQEAWA